MPPTSTPTNTPTKTPAVDLSGAKLTVRDFPTGFQELTPAELTQLGESEASLTQAFCGVSTQAKPQNFTAFLNPTKFQLVMSLLIYPMTILEKAKFDLDLSNSEAALKQLGTGLGSTSKVTLLPGYDKIGDKSIGFTTSLASGTLTMRMDMVIVSRGNAVEMTISMYQDGTQPPANLADLTKTLDTRAAAGLGIKQ